MKTEPQIGIITVGHFDVTPRQHGSTFLRAENLIAVSDKFELWKHGKRYESLLFQKAYWSEMLQLFEGPKILDLTDPDWIKGSCSIMEIGSLADAITCSSIALTDYVSHLFPGKIVECVPDRLNFGLYTQVRQQHEGRAKTAAWFGYDHNAVETLPKMVDVLKKNELRLTVIANREPKELDLLLDYEYIPYDRNTVNDCIQRSDIVLNPKSEKAFFKYKSTNKSVLSWKLGVPVAETPADVVRFLDAEERNNEVALRAVEVNEEYNILKSAQQYEHIIDRIRLTRS